MTKDEAIGELTAFATRCTAIMELSGGKCLTWDKKDEAQQTLLLELRDELVKRCDELKQRERQGTLDKLESEFVKPALRLARYRLNKTGDPYLIRTDIEHFLQQLQSPGT